MVLGLRSKIIPLPDHRFGNIKLGSVTKDAIGHRPCRVRCSHSTASSMEETKERIRETFGKNELSPSSYDTAWVAMVPSRYSMNQPCFPQCLDWILENQREDGSWGLNPSHPLLVKDSLSSTLACLLALRKWRIGDNQVKRGLGFIETHGWAVDNKDQISPLGFEVIFPSMIKYAEKLNLDLPLDPNLVNMILCERELTIERALKNEFEGNLANVEYFAEGLGELCHWKEIMLHQRHNGSIFDSPACTAAALIYHQHDEKCFGYLNSILKLHENWVPTIYPTKIHSNLFLVDALQNLGVDRYFKTELKSVLDEIYRLWLEKNEEIFSDVAHCAMAFRLLRMNNYEVSSEELEGFVDQEHFFTTSAGKLMSHVAILELHRASQVAIHERKDHILDQISTWTRNFMEQKLLDNQILDRSKKEMEFAMRKFYGTFDRVETRRYIESYKMDNFKILKAAYRSSNINNIDLLKFSEHDFNLCQARHKEELQQMKRWFTDCKLEQVGLSQQYLYTCYFLIAAILFEPDYADARLAYAKYTIIITVVDDFFDCFVCKEELQNIIELVERWNRYSTVGFCSERVRIFFLALYKMVEEVAAKAENKQGRCVKDHLINLWIDMLKCMMVELDLSKIESTTPSIEEYLSVSCVTIGVPCIVLTSLYLLGPKLSKDVIESSEVSALCNCTAAVARLINDIHSYKREQAESSTNMVSILITQSQGTISEEEAIRQIKEMMESKRRELLGMVLNDKESQLPQVCKDLFWTTIKAGYSIYTHGDEYRFPEELKNHTNDVIYKPLNQYSP